MAESALPMRRRTVGVRDIPLALVAPRRVFLRVEDVGAWGWPLVLLLAATTLLGFAIVETGLIDREVDRQVAARIYAIDMAQRNVVERSQLRELYESERKLGEFLKLITRIRVVAAEPLKILAGALLISAFLYGVVALTGRKPEWNTLLTICVFAGFAELLRLAMSLSLMLRHGALDVDTSLALLMQRIAGTPEASPAHLAALAGGLTALDPFRIWFWALVYIGLTTTAQLRGWRAWVVCAGGWLTGAALRSGLAMMAAGGAG